MQLLKDFARNPNKNMIIIKQRSVGLSVRWLVGRSNGRSVGRSVGRSAGRSVSRSVGLSVIRSVGRPVGRRRATAALPAELLPPLTPRRRRPDLDMALDIFRCKRNSTPPPSHSRGKTAIIDSYTRNLNDFTKKKIKLRSQ